MKKKSSCLKNRWEHVGTCGIPCAIRLSAFPHVLWHVGTSGNKAKGKNLRVQFVPTCSHTIFPCGNSRTPCAARDATCSHLFPHKNTTNSIAALYQQWRPWEKPTGLRTDEGGGGKKSRKRLTGNHTLPDAENFFPCQKEFKWRESRSEAAALVRALVTAMLEQKKQLLQKSAVHVVTCGTPCSTRATAVTTCNHTLQHVWLHGKPCSARGTACNHMYRRKKQNKRKKSLP